MTFKFCISHQTIKKTYLTQKCGFYEKHATCSKVVIFKRYFYSEIYGPILLDMSLLLSTVFRQGDIGTSWYAVLSGSLDVKVSETANHQVRPSLSTEAVYVVCAVFPSFKPQIIILSFGIDIIYSVLFSRYPFSCKRVLSLKEPVLSDSPQC